MSQNLDELGRQAAALIVERHGARLRQGETVEIGFSHHKGARRIELRLSDREADRLQEIFVDIPELEDAEALDLGLNFLDGVLAEALAGEREATPPLEPAPYSFEGHALHLSGELRRPDLEAAADALLDAEDDPEA